MGSAGHSGAVAYPKPEMRVEKHRIPLIKPYDLSFATVRAFDTWVVTFTDGQATGYGEVTALPGYSWETVEEIERFIASAYQDYLRADSLQTFLNGLKPKVSKNPFASTALISAAETFMEGGKVWEWRPERGIPVVALVSGESADDINVSVAAAVEQGFGTMKFKLTGDLSHDTWRTRAVCAALPEGCSLRLDANQGYALEDALEFCRLFENEPAIELLEQPFGISRWDLQKTLSEQTTLPLMLDESIWSEDDIKRTADEKLASYVKLKLFKHAGIENTLRLIEVAGEYDLKVVLGNGVQTELGCHIENYIYSAKSLETAGEMNGFLKTTEDIFEHPLKVEGGKVCYDSSTPFLKKEHGNKFVKT